MIPLRLIALGSNVAFLTYGALLHLYPVLLLHIVLMPVNLWRLTEILRLKGHMRTNEGSDAVFAALLPFATRLTVKKGEVVIRKSDSSDCVYLVFEGALWVAEAEIELGPAALSARWACSATRICAPRPSARYKTARSGAYRRRISTAFISLIRR